MKYIHSGENKYSKTNLLHYLPTHGIYLKIISNIHFLFTTINVSKNFNNIEL